MAGPPGAARRQRHDRGQHFLANAALATRLVRDAEIGADDRVVEFGAGHGILTDALARRGAHVLAVELAPTLVAGLAERFVATPP